MIQNSTCMMVARVGWCVLQSTPRLRNFQALFLPIKDKTESIDLLVYIAVITVFLFNIPSNFKHLCIKLNDVYFLDCYSI